MSPNGRTYLLLVAIFLLIIFIVWFLLGVRVMQSNPVTDPVQPELMETAPQQITPILFNDETSPTVLVSTKSGSTFSVPNFLVNSGVQKYDENMFLIAESQSLEGTLYQIFFNRAGGINVTLGDSDLEFARQQAELELKQLVSNSEIQLCALAISVTVPGWLSQELGVDYSGIDYGLSFCPTSLSFD